eukprot:CAMPEP_0185849214 /NCGR_PEP_ID=MMETSP1354-20130828/3786_1 /TAXON_ID=708628 /ORGANISM="Erythrolobus madagascarensis, Strain CCMP3276" /LENGTH=246 /DNA_ID=CAMNT_0028549697 /DNA_START=32 /DNA_END=772 /DNA_ORIENTATION=+
MNKQVLAFSCAASPRTAPAPLGAGRASGGCALRVERAAAVPRSRRISSARASKMALCEHEPDNFLVGPEPGSRSANVDWFRDTPLRYLGYANECGESFRFFIGAHGVWLTYGIASLYVASDSVYQAVRAGRAGTAEDQIEQRIKSAKLFLVAVDSLLWQSFASVIIPGYIINRIVFASNYAMDHLSHGHLGPAVEHWFPTVAGLVMIPAIVRPIDDFVHRVMDVVVRPVSSAMVDHLEGPSRKAQD